MCHGCLCLALIMPAQQPSTQCAYMHCMGELSPTKWDTCDTNTVAHALVRVSHWQCWCSHVHQLPVRSHSVDTSLVTMP
jgi:hypothetical protein